MKNIHWLVPRAYTSKKEINEDGLASLRLRSALFNKEIFSDYQTTFHEKIENINLIDFLFVGKFISKREDLFYLWNEYIHQFKIHKKPIFLDYTDHNLIKENEFIKNFYNENLKKSTKIVVSSSKMKEHLIEYDSKISIIEDPLEISIEKIKKNNNSIFLFYGNHLNLKYLLNLIPLWDTSKEYTLIIQSSEIGLKLIQDQSRDIYKPVNLNIHLQHWSIKNMLKVAENVSGIIIPGDIHDDRKNGVSHNRLITAFALGLPVAATRYESYLEFDHQFADIDNKTEFVNFLQNPLLYSSRVEMAQKKVKNYNQENIVKKWLNLIK